MTSRAVENLLDFLAVDGVGDGETESHIAFSYVDDDDLRWWWRLRRLLLMKLSVGTARGAGRSKWRYVPAAVTISGRQRRRRRVIVVQGMLMLQLFVDGARGDDLRVGVVGIVRHGISTNHFDVDHVPDVHALKQRDYVLMRPA